jgi:putative tryptophan/tyrosine transport system substrate-binding protein
VKLWRLGLTVVLSVGILASPLAVEAQRAGKMPRVGVLAETAPPPAPNRGLAAFRQSLRELGYVEEQNVLIAIRWSEGVSGRQAALISELIRIPVDVIVVQVTGAALAAKRATSTIPIVSAGAGALVEAGAVASLARPGGNVTGLTALTTELSAKRLELLKEAVPNISRVAVLMSPYRTVPSLGEGLLKATEAAAQVVGVHLQVLRIEEPADLEGAFQAARRGQAGAVIILANPFFIVHAARVAELALKYRLPTIGSELAIAEAGGFMRYSVNGPDLWRRAAIYVDKILKGAKPADLPIEQPTKFELIINLKTAKALGLTVPQSLLIRADELIQ